MSKQCRLLIKAVGGKSPMSLHTCDGNMPLNVIDLSTRITIKVCAREVSPYCHTLLLEGTEYQILNVMRH